jgi:hypothetical protein
MKLALLIVILLVISSLSFGLGYYVRHRWAVVHLSWFDAQARIIAELTRELAERE